MKLFKQKWFWLTVILLAETYCLLTMAFPQHLIPNYLPYGSMAVYTYPDKLIYVVGEDTELDLTGGNVCLHEGSYETNGLPCAMIGNEPCGEILPMADCAYTTDADFTLPGQYAVRLIYGKGIYKLEHGFTIQVIDPANLE